MKKINYLVSVALLFSAMIANAQNFSVFEKSKCYFFERNSTVYAVKADSVVNQSSGDTICHLFTMFWEDLSNPQNCLDLYGGTLFGKQAILASDSSLVLVTKDLDSVILKPNTAVGDSWIAYRWPGQDLMIKATVSGQSPQNVLGAMDEVKSVVLSVQNGANQVVTGNPFNGKVLNLSQNSGLLNTFDFYHFPNDTSLYTLIEATPVADYRKMVINRVFDFKVGDEFHTINRNFNYMGYQLLNGSEEQMMKKVISKTTYIPDTAITYLFERCAVTKIYLDSQITTTNSYDSVSITYSYQNFADSALFQMPFQTFPVSDIWYGHKINHQSLINNQRVYGYPDRVDVNLMDTCWSYICADPGPGATTYLEGLGGPYFDENGWGLTPSNSYKLVYYQKGETTWGTPVASSCLSLINNVQELNATKSEINVYPNPAMNKIFVDLQNFDSKYVTLEVVSMDGRVLQHHTIAANSISELDIQSLPSGMFVLKISDKDHHVLRLISKM